MDRVSDAIVFAYRLVGAVAMVAVVVLVVYDIAVRVMQ